MKFVALLGLVLTSLSSLSQPNRSWAAFFQRINVSTYEGQRFKVSAVVRTDSLEPGANAEVWVRIDNSDHSMGFFDNMKNRPIRSNQWKTYTIEGRIDQQAQWLFLGGIYQNRGNFYFDDFHLQIEKNGAFEEIPLQDAGFEQDTAAFKQSWMWFGPRPDKNWSLTTSSSFEGLASVRIDGTHFSGYGENPSAGRYITANGIRLYYETYGQGRPLLLLHGNSGSISSFTQQIPVLSRYYKVIAVDTRGQGKSTEDGRLYTYDLFADDMKALLDALHLDSIDVLGWSDGGNTGLIMAMKYPEKIHKLAVMGANIFIDSTVVSPDIIDIVRQRQDELKGDTTYRGRNSLRLATLLLTQPQHRFEDLAVIHTPVLVMAGEKDIIREGHTRQIAGHIPGGQLMLFPGGTHNEPAEDPQLFNQTVLDFFAD